MLKFKGNVELDPTDQRLLEKLYPKAAKLDVRKLSGGLSGSLVLQVHAIDARGIPAIPQVVKIGGATTLPHEAEKSEEFRSRATHTIPIGRRAEESGRAAVIYEDADAQKHSKMLSLGDYFDQHTAGDVSTALYHVLGIQGLGKSYSAFSVKNLDQEEILAAWFPPPIILTIRGNRSGLGIYPEGQAPKDIQPRMTIEPQNFETAVRGQNPSDLVKVHGFLLKSIDRRHVTLTTAAEGPTLRIRVQHDGNISGFPPVGTAVEVVGLFAPGRDSALRSAVEHCLTTAGARRVGKNWLLVDEAFPDPLDLFSQDGIWPGLVAHGMIHGDLHWDNVLLETSEHWWLIDYGQAGENPIFFDFIKLESFLRCLVLGKHDIDTPALIRFEIDLLENPLGELPAQPLGNDILDKAAHAIRTIRQQARRYSVDDMLDYWQLLFLYGLSLTKYYPAEDDRQDSDELRKKHRETLLPLLMAMTIGRALKWYALTQEGRLFDRHFPQRLEFVQYGTQRGPADKTIVLDVGNHCLPGVIDHHQMADNDDCATSLVLKTPSLVTTHLTGVPPGEETWVLHSGPDFDCAASLYLAWHLHVLGYFPPGAGELSRYAKMVDAGASEIENVPNPSRTPYCVFQRELECKENLHNSGEARVLRGFELLDIFCRLEWSGQHPFRTNRLPQQDLVWKVEDDKRLFDKHDRGGHAFTSPIVQDSRAVPVKALYIDKPRSTNFKIWARLQKFVLLVVRESAEDEEHDHFITISVPPNLKGALTGLANFLEDEECKERATRQKQRPQDAAGKPPRFPLYSESADPWFGGTGCHFDNTIVASPGAGTVLKESFIIEVLEKGAWTKPPNGIVSAARFI